MAGSLSIADFLESGTQNMRGDGQKPATYTLFPRTHGLEACERDFSTGSAKNISENTAGEKREHHSRYGVSRQVAVLRSIDWGIIVFLNVRNPMRHIFGWIVPIFFLFVMSGCHHAAPRRRVIPTTYQVNAIVRPGDPKPHAIYLVQLDVYQIDVPFGSVSANKEFWDHLDSADLDPEQSALLLKNGFHLGEGQITDWDFFRNILEKNPVHTRISSRVAYQEQHEPIVTRADQPACNLFYFDSSGEVVGRSFDAADDELLLSFWPTPRHDGQVHIQLLPGVRLKEEQLQHEWVNGVESVNTVRPEFFYDLKLEADLDVNHFLIVAPSAAASRISSMGNAFMVDNGEGSRTETLLIFVARPIGGAALMQAVK
jgi:hypothetical protein